MSHKSRLQKTKRKTLKAKYSVSFPKACRALSMYLLNVRNEIYEYSLNNFN
jgi:hypothetical protein